jgi:hypothetical protein
MFLRSRTPQPGGGGGGYNQWGVLMVGVAIGAGLGFLAGNTHSQEGWKNLKHAITERNLFLNGIVNPFEPEGPKPYEPAFDPGKNFTTPAAQLGVEFENKFPKIMVANSKKVYEGKPRVRREWRTLSVEQREMFAKAFRIMVTEPTQKGREKYGKLYWNFQDLVAFHVCSVVDPRCDQGHFGPNFITFHTAYMLRIELSLLAVCNVEFDNACKEANLGIPYWDVAKDGVGQEYYGDPEKGIFTSNYFGSRPQETDNWQVTDGLFANWPVAEYEEDRFGPTSDMAGPNNYNKVATCFKERWFYPGFPRSENVNLIQFPDTGLLDESKFEANNVSYAANGQGTNDIPYWCSDECKKDHTKCPRYFRLDQYSCNPYVTRTIAVGNGNSMMSGGSTDMLYDENDFNACTNPKWIRNHMDWMNCIEKRLDGMCETRPIDAILEVQEGDISMDSKSIEEFRNVIMGTKKQIEKHGSGELWNKENRSFTEKSGFLIPGITTCGNPKGYYDTDMGRKSVNCLHAMGHIKLGDEMVDTGTSANDAGPFTGLHANLVRSYLQWRMNAEDFPEVKDEYYHYPSSQDRAVWGEHVGKVPYGTSGPYGTYDMSYCLAPEVYYRYQDRERNGYYKKADGTNGTYSDAYNFVNGPWLNGTMLDEVVNAGYPYYYLFDDVNDDADGKMNKDGGQLGYTHKEILYWTMPERTPYTYDTMMYQYTGHGAVKTDQVSQAEADGEQNTEDEEVLVELEDAEIENGEPVQATTAGGFSTKKFSVVLGAITFMWYYLSMVMWW